jgi:hypothetical protein
LRDRDLTLFVLACLALAALRRGEVERAGILWGAVSEERHERATDRAWADLAPLSGPLAEATGSAFLSAVETGRQRTLEQAVQTALDETAQTVP